MPMIQRAHIGVGISGQEGMQVGLARSPVSTYGMLVRPPTSTSPCKSHATNKMRRSLLFKTHFLRFVLISIIPLHFLYIYLSLPAAS